MGSSSSLERREMGVHIELNGSPLIFVLNNWRRVLVRDKNFIVYLSLWSTLMMFVIAYVVGQVGKSLDSYAHPDQRLGMKRNEELSFPPMAFCASNPDVPSFFPKLCRFAPDGPARKPAYTCDVVKVDLELEIMGTHVMHKCVVLRGQGPLANDTVLHPNGALSAPIDDTPPPPAIDRAPRRGNTTSAANTSNTSNLPPLYPTNSSTAPRRTALNMSAMMQSLTTPAMLKRSRAQTALVVDMLEVDEGLRTNAVTRVTHPGNSGLLENRTIANATYAAAQFQLTFDSHASGPQQAFKHVLFHPVVTKTTTQNEDSAHKFIPTSEHINPIFVPVTVDAWTKLYSGRTEDIGMKLKTVEYFDETVVYTYQKTLRPVPCTLPLIDGRTQDCTNMFSTHVHFETLTSDYAEEIVTFDWLYVLGSSGGAITIAELVMLIVFPLVQRVLFGPAPSRDTVGDGAGDGIAVDTQLLDDSVVEKSA